MKFKFYVFGSIKNRNMSELTQYYARLITKYHSFELVILKDRSKGQVTSNELSPHLASLKESSNCLVGLTSEGPQLTSLEFSKHLQKWRHKFGGVHVFCGNAFGFAAESQKLFDETLSLSKLTFPHELAAVVFLEQLYRGLNLLAGGKYHH